MVTTKQKWAWLKKWAEFEMLKETQAYKDALMRVELATKMAWLNKWAAAKEAEAAAQPQMAQIVPRLGVLGLGLLQKTASDMAHGVPTNWNIYSPNFWGYNIKGFVRGLAPRTYAQHVRTDKQIDARNTRMWEQNPDPNANVPVNRGSTVLRNGQPISIAGVTGGQRRAVLDTLDAIHRRGEDEGAAPPSVRSPLIPPHSFLARIPFLTPAAGRYNPVLNRLEVSPNTEVLSDENTVLHEIGHWKQNQRLRQEPRLYRWSRVLGYPFSKAIADNEEFHADAEAYRLNSLVHPDSRMTEQERRGTLNALGQGKDLISYLKSLAPHEE